MRKQRIVALLGFGLLGLVATAGPAQAHFPWLNADNYRPHIGETPKLNIGWGHRYPLGSFLRMKDVENMVLRTPDGQEAKLQSIDAVEFKPEEALEKAGVYTIAAQRKSGFYTKTTEGGKRQSKEGLENVLRCSKSHMNMKALLAVGDADQDQDKGIDTTPVGHSLEIIPQANPASLQAGDYFPVQLLLHGKPYKSKIFATYMGFSTEKDVFAYTAKTDQQGMGKIRILQPGVWLIKAEYEKPYSDQQVCDVESFSATLTLEVP
ncbi:MAG: DUF4198 domain-containing protein [Candidatus Electrothrix sp. AS4_5]|nr:DUF4198 domain-containing protein [Candidatus Electrothrix gigas]MCI5188471.1 DUF4198 domain-containing protein [Candidatus Electrothrix gigas]